MKFQSRFNYCVQVCTAAKKSCPHHFTVEYNSDTQSSEHGRINLTSEVP